MALVHFASEEFMVVGLQLCGFSQQTIGRNCYNTNLERFKDSYYVTPTVCSLVFQDIQRDDIPNKIYKPNPKYLLLALRYLKKYPTKHEMAGFLDCCGNTAEMQSRLVGNH